MLHEQILSEQIKKQSGKIEMAMKLMSLANGDGHRMLEQIAVQCACAMAMGALSYIAINVASVAGAETGVNPKQIAEGMMPLLIGELRSELATYQDGERDAVPSEQDTQDTPKGRNGRGSQLQIVGGAGSLSAHSGGGE